MSPNPATSAAAEAAASTQLYPSSPAPAPAPAPAHAARSRSGHTSSPSWRIESNLTRAQLEALWASWLAPPSEAYLESRRHVSDNSLGRPSWNDPFGIHDVPEILVRATRELVQFDDWSFELRRQREKIWHEFREPVTQLKAASIGGPMRFQSRW